jgi:hypothetical protein
MTWSAPIERTRPAFAVLATPGDRGPEGLGELHGVAADAARGADDQDLLPSPDSPVAQALPGGEPGDRDDRGPLEAQPGGLADQFVLSRSGVFGE